MRFIYSNRNWLSKISLVAFSLFLTLSLANFSGAQTTKITGTFTAREVSSTFATIGGVITNSQSELQGTALKIRLGTGGTFFLESGVITPDSGGNINVKINNLKPDTQYDFQVFDSANRLSPTDVFSFRTGLPNPINAALETQAITKESAHIEGQIFNPQPEAPKKFNFRIEYGINPLNAPNDFENVTDLLQITADGRFAVTLSGLEAFTEYEYRVFDTEGIYGPSAVVAFKTAGNAQINASSFVSILGPNSVKIGGQILDPEQRSLSLRIEYGLKSGVFSNFSAQSGILQLDSAGNFFDVTLTGLQAGTTYQYRVTAGSSQVDPSPVGEFTTFDASGSGGSSGSGIGGSGTGAVGVPPGGSSGGTGAVGVPPGDSSGLTGLQNPLKFDTLAGFIKSVLDIVLTIGIPIIAIFIIYSGFLFVKARGNPEELKVAKSTFLWTIVGAAILMASWILALAICETVVNLGNTTTQCR